MVEVSTGAQAWFGTPRGCSGKPPDVIWINIKDDDQHFALHEADIDTVIEALLDIKDWIPRYRAEW